jgi:hypothetical protein
MVSICVVMVVPCVAAFNISVSAIYVLLVFSVCSSSCEL